MIALRRMTAGDLPLFKKWLLTPHVARWYHDSDDWIAEVEGVDGEYSWLHHFIVEADGAPVGFCQYYAGRDSGEPWLARFGVDGVYSIDYLIGEPAALRRGFGRQLVEALTAEIRRCGDARLIAVQPETENAASRALLRACGFALADGETGIYVKEL